jgi:hypothetical protein
MFKRPGGASPPARRSPREPATEPLGEESRFFLIDKKMTHQLYNGILKNPI